MNTRQPLLGLVAMLVLCAAHAVEQEAAHKWTVAVVVAPALNPLPIGFCAAVQLSVLDPATGEPPRDPLGNRVTIADFDMTVAPAGAFAGERIDRSHWSVCACPQALPGTEATITARYPAQAPSSGTRIPGIAVASATLTTSAPKGPSVPAACTSTAGATPPPPPPVQNSIASPYVPLVATELAPPTLIAVLKTEWALPYQGNALLSSGLCKVVFGSFTNPAIRETDTVVVTGRAALKGEHLKWTAVVGKGTIHFNVCNWMKMTQGTTDALDLNGRKLNILVLR
jgi:hypothetical protein